MKVYVDELPKSCEECPFFDLKDGYCSQQEMHLDFEFRKDTGIDVDCPLQSLADYTKQVRKKVCEEIRKMLPNYIYSFQEPEVPRTKVIELEDVKYILDQIQGETKSAEAK